MEHQTDQVILVDDCDENIRHGLDVVFPQPWNTRREISWFSPHEKVEYVRMAITDPYGKCVNLTYKIASCNGYGSHIIGQERGRLSE